MPNRTIRVQPMPNSSKWQVKVSGKRVSTHRKKSAAKRKARRKAHDGDHLYIHRRNGTVQNEVTVGGGGDY